MADYYPNSHFLVSHRNLANSSSINLAQDAFGPVSTNLTSKSRTTLFVRASARTKVFAICDGQIMIQQLIVENIKLLNIWFILAWKRIVSLRITSFLCYFFIQSK